ncbi:MAG: YiaA/YiaB family inner membrane protein [Bacteroidota bacterium]
MNGYIYEYNNTKSFYTMAWVSFIISSVGVAVGLIYLDSSLAMKGFIGMSYLFSVVSCFTLAKVVRDKHEADKFITKVENAKTEKFLNENTTVSTV